MTMFPFRTFAVVVALALSMASGYAQPVPKPLDDVLSRDAVLRDPAIPVAGNPQGDITIVEFFDFQCPYCRKAHADLQTLLKEDGKVRLVYKDWPILGDVSMEAARLVQAAKYQEKFTQAHDALMKYKGRLTAANLNEILAGAGIDTKKLAADLKANEAAIKDTLARNNAQAEAFGFNATPSFIIGTFRVPGALDLATFKLAVKDARELQKKQGNQ
jgi:protein-disulfide isomerase